MIQLTLLLAVLTASEPQPLRLERTEVRTVVSRTNGIEYSLYVALPHGYGTPGRRFPVVYLLDADYSFLIARNITDHLAERNHLREVILVGIAYGGPPQYRMNRTRDYTPAFAAEGGYGREMQKVSGGGVKFRKFLQEELIPFVDATYTTAVGDRCLVGHSYGGLFASWNLVSTPALFSRYIIVSPSLWYDHRRLLKQFIGRVTGRDFEGTRVYAAVGDREGDGEMAADLRRFTTALRGKSVRGLSLSSDVLGDETHNSVFPRALSNGLRFVFEGR